MPAIGSSCRTGGMLAATIVVFLCSTAAQSAEVPGNFDPEHPQKSGYRLVFDEEFANASDLDISGNHFSRPDAKLYSRLFPQWGYASPSKAFVIDHGVLTIAGGQLGTAAPEDNAKGYVGTTFSGGAYFEARIAFNPDTVHFSPHAPISPGNWWPSFYSVAVEYLTGADQWPGEARGYVHFAEDDFFEAWQERYRYGATMHDWYGLQGCHGHPGGFGVCDIANDGTSKEFAPNSAAVNVPMTTDWNEFHTIGNLWVSGARASDHRGFSLYYFDGQATKNRVDWISESKSAAPPSRDNVFGVIDQDHMVVYIGSPANTPLRVKWIRVWQPKTPETDSH